jgi:threonine dehydratase
MVERSSIALLYNVRLWKSILVSLAPGRDLEILTKMSFANIDPAAIAAAERLIRPRIRRTPVVEVNGADLGLNFTSLTLKLELLQHTGSFKTRGAFVNLLSRDLPVAGVVAASGGNHGAAVAFAAQQIGTRATIFVPSVASPAKIDRIRGYGANLVIAGDRYADALAASEAWTIGSGALPIHAYNDRETLLGQGTVGLELDQQAPDLDTLLVAVGGGGLIGGIAAWYRGRVEVVGVEPETAPTLTAALAAGFPVEAEASGIAADSLAPKCVGELMFPIAQEFVKRVVLVTDDEIQRAQEVLWDVLSVAAEPGGAAALAALLSRRYEPRRDERVAVLVCGGNTSAVRFGGVASCS